MSRTNKLTKWQGRREDDHSDHQTNRGIKVIFILPVCEPNDQTRGDHANVAQGIAQDMKDEGLHIHRPCMGVTVAMPILCSRGGNLRPRMVVPRFKSFIK